MSFEFKNEGRQPHELVLYRLHDDVTEPVMAVFSQGEKQAKAKAKAKLVAGAFAPPGQSQHFVARLEPGRYAVACFTPLGGDSKGPLHLSKGELAEFRVR